jgi:hypothetical protein
LGGLDMRGGCAPDCCYGQVSVCCRAPPDVLGEAVLSERYRLCGSWKQPATGRFQQS